MAKPSKLPEWDTTQVNSIEPDQAHKDEGWLAPGGVPEKPPFQTFNYWQNEVFRWLNEINIAGILIYDALTDYVAGISYVVGSDGNLYICWVNNGPATAVVDPVGDTTGVWSIFETNIYRIDASETDQGITGNGRTIKAFVDAIGTSKKATLILTHNGIGNTTAYTLTTSKTIPDNIILIIENGAILDGVGTLTAKNIEARSYKIFGSSITVSGLKETHPEWWEDNITPGTTDMATAVQAAITAGTHIILSNEYGIGSSLSALNSGITIEGIGGSKLKALAAFNGDILVLYNAAGIRENAIIRNIQFTSASQRTAGIAIKVLDYTEVTIDNCYFYNQYDCVSFNTFLNGKILACEFEDFYNNGVHVNFGDGLYIDNCTIFNNTSISATAVGVYIRQGGGVIISSTDITRCNYGLRVKPEVGESAKWIFSRCALYDTCNYGVYVDGSVGEVDHYDSNGSWYASNEEDGITLHGVDGAVFNGDMIYLNGKHGVNILTGTEWSDFGNCTIAANGVGTGGYYGINVDADVDKFNIHNSKFLNNYANSSVNLQAYGIGIAAGTSENFTIKNNVFNGNVTGTILNGSTSSNFVIKDNFTDLTHDLASAATVTLPEDHDYYNITGTTNITDITSSWVGRKVTLKFAAVLTFTDGNNLKLAGNFVTTADDIITLISDGAWWNEISRSVN